ncbi:hypothetical protein NMG60_11001917 [Bertholletia excelsa]
MGAMSPPPGFRFHPTDEEVVAYYLDRKIIGGTIDLDIIPEVDLYKCEPWDLSDKSLLRGKDMEWYLYSPRDRKYPNGLRTNRATRAGYWKATGKDRPVYSHHKQQSAVVTIDMKKTLVYYRGRAPHGLRINWVMHECRLLQPSSTSCSYLADSYALCRLFEKTPHVATNKKVQKEPPESQVRGLSNSTAQVIQAKEADEYGDDNLENEFSNRKTPSDASSSHISQCTPVETDPKSDSQPPVPSIESNNIPNNLLYSSGCNPSNQIHVQSFLIYPYL